MRGDQVTLSHDEWCWIACPHGQRVGATGTVTGILNGLVIVAWRFGNTTTHKSEELRRS